MASPGSSTARSGQAYGDYLMHLPSAWRPLASLSVRDVSRRTNFTAFMGRDRDADVVGVESSRTERIRQELMAKHPQEGKQMISLMVYAEERRLDAIDREEHAKLKAKLVEQRERAEARKLESIKLPRFVDAQGNSVPIGSQSARAWMLEHNPDVYHRWASLVRDATVAQQQHNYTHARHLQMQRAVEIEEKLMARQQKREMTVAEHAAEAAAARAAEAETAARHREAIVRRAGEMITEQQKSLAAELEEKNQRAQDSVKQTAMERDAAARQMGVTLSKKLDIAQETVAAKQRREEREALKKRQQWELQVARSESKREGYSEAKRQEAADDLKRRMEAAEARRDEVAAQHAEHIATLQARMEKKDEVIRERIDRLATDHHDFVKRVEERLAVHEDKHLKILDHTAKVKTAKHIERIDKIWDSRSRYVATLTDKAAHAGAMSARLPASNHSLDVDPVEEHKYVASDVKPPRTLVPSPPKPLKAPTAAAIRQRRASNSPGSASKRSPSHSSSKSPYSDRSIGGSPTEGDTEHQSPSPTHRRVGDMHVSERVLQQYDHLDARAEQIRIARERKQAQADKLRAEEERRRTDQSARNKKWVETRIAGMALANTKQTNLEEKNKTWTEPPKKKHFSPPKSLLLWAPKLRDPFEERQPPPPLPTAALASAGQSPFEHKANPLVTSSSTAKLETTLSSGGGGVATAATLLPPDAALREAARRAEAKAQADEERRRQEAERNAQRERAAEERRRAEAQQREVEYKQRLHERLQKHEASNQTAVSRRVEEANKILELHRANQETSTLRKDDFVTERALRAAADASRRATAAKHHRDEQLREKQALQAQLQHERIADAERFRMITDDEPPGPFSSAPIAAEPLTGAED